MQGEDKRVTRWKEPTLRQLEILRGLRDMTSEHRIAPTIREMADRFDVWPGAIEDAYAALERRGLIERVVGAKRAVKLTEAGSRALREGEAA